MASNTKNSLPQSAAAGLEHIDGSRTKGTCGQTQAPPNDSSDGRVGG